MGYGSGTSILEFPDSGTAVGGYAKGSETMPGIHACGVNWSNRRTWDCPWTAGDRRGPMYPIGGSIQQFIWKALWSCDLAYPGRVCDSTGGRLFPFDSPFDNRHAHRNRRVVSSGLLNFCSIARGPMPSMGRGILYQVVHKTIHRFCGWSRRHRPKPLLLSATISLPKTDLDHEDRVRNRVRRQ